MSRLARALVGVAVVCASSRAFAEAQEQQRAVPQKAASPQPQPVPQQPAPQIPPPVTKNPAQPSPAAKNAPPQAKVATPTKKAAAKAAPKRPPPTVDTGAQVLGAGDGAPGPGPRCKVAPIKGTPLFEARFNSGQKRVITRLYPTGTFTRAVLKEQKSACIEQAQLDEIRIALKEAPWKTTKSPATCLAVSAETTEIYAAGALRFTSRTCNPLVLDKLSSRALDLIAQDVGPFGLDLANELVEGN